MTQYMTSCMTQNVGAIFLAKIAKKGRMTQKCMTQNVRPFLLVILIVVLYTNQFNFCFRAFRKISPGRYSLLRNLQYVLKTNGKHVFFAKISRKYKFCTKTESVVCIIDKPALSNSRICFQKPVISGKYKKFESDQCKLRTSTLPGENT